MHTLILTDDQHRVIHLNRTLNGLRKETGSNGQRLTGPPTLPDIRHKCRCPNDPFLAFLSAIKSLDFVKKDNDLIFFPQNVRKMTTISRLR